MTAITLSQLKFSYPTSGPILDIPQLSIESGEKVFIHGPSGSGKSTLLNLMAGVLTPTGGEISLLDKSLGSLGQNQRDQLRGNHIGFIFQNFNLISYLSVKENIILPIISSKTRASRVVGSIDEEVQKLASHLKLEEFLNKRVTNLSVGQQQRVAVARALMGSPELIIADEPTSSLDDDVTESFVKLILEEQQEKKFTLVFVSHDKRLAQYFDREISLSDINGRKDN